VCCLCTELSKWKCSKFGRRARLSILVMAGHSRTVIDADVENITVTSNNQDCKLLKVS
jgi:hypothetical protein